MLKRLALTVLVAAAALTVQPVAWAATTTAATAATAGTGTGDCPPPQTPEQTTAAPVADPAAGPVGERTPIFTCDTSWGG
jgi:hypothetical protein